MKVNSAYLDLRQSGTGRILDSMRVELTAETAYVLKRLARRNGMNLFVTRDGWSTSTYSVKTWNTLKVYEVDYLYSQRINK